MYWYISFYINGTTHALWGMLGATPIPALGWRSVGCGQLTAKSLSRTCLKLKETAKPQVCSLPGGTLCATTGVKKPDPSQLRTIPAPKFPLGWAETSVATASEREEKTETKRQRDRDREIVRPNCPPPNSLFFIFSCLELSASVHFFICLRFFLEYFSQTIAWISGWYFYLFFYPDQQVFWLALVFFRCLQVPIMVSEKHDTHLFSFLFSCN